MTRTFLRCSAGFAVVLAVLPTTAQDTRARLEGIVEDGSKPAVGVLALVNDYESVWHMKTNSQGEFSFFVPSGCYDVLLSSQSFHPAVKRICLESGEVKRLSIKLKREVSVRAPLSKD
jgi:hypothetical protein